MAVFICCLALLGPPRRGNYHWTRDSHLKQTLRNAGKYWWGDESVLLAQIFLHGTIHTMPMQCLMLLHNCLTPVRHYILQGGSNWGFSHPQSLAGGQQMSPFKHLFFFWLSFYYWGDLPYQLESNLSPIPLVVFVWLIICNIWPGGPGVSLSALPG